MRNYAKMVAAGAAVAILSSGAWLAAGTLVYAAEDDTVSCQLEMDSQEVSRGDTVTVNVNLLENPGFILEDGIVTYDENVLELQSEPQDLTAEDSNGTGAVYKVETQDLFRLEGYSEKLTNQFTRPVPHNGQIRILDGYAEYQENSTKTGTMFTLTFKVKDDVAIGTTGTLKYDGIFFSYVSEQDAKTYLSDCQDLTFTVICKHTNTTEKVTKEPGYGKEGEKQTICTDCNEVLETQVIPATEYITKEELQVTELEAGDSGYEKVDISQLVADKTIDASTVKFKTYEITMVDENGQAVQPEGKITVKFPCPDGYDGSKCKIYYVAENGALTDMLAVFKEGYLFFDTTHFSTYIVTETELVTETPAVPVLYGDVNGDGDITLMDSALIRRSLAGWNVTIDRDIADVNGDGDVTLMDSALIRRYLAGWNVTLRQN